MTTRTRLALTVGALLLLAFCGSVAFVGVKWSRKVREARIRHELSGLLSQAFDRAAAGDFVGANKIHESRAKAFKELGDRKEAFEARYQIARNLQYTSEVEEALSQLEVATREFEEVTAGCSSDYSYYRKTRALCLLEAGKLGEAESLAKECFEADCQSMGRNAESEWREFFGRVAIARRDWAAADKSFSESISILELIGGKDHHLLRTPLILRAMVRIEEGMVADAVADAERARLLHLANTDPAFPRFGFEAALVLINASIAQQSGDVETADKEVSKVIGILGDGLTLSSKGASESGEQIPAYVARTQAVFFHQQLSWWFRLRCADDTVGRNPHCDEWLRSLEDNRRRATTPSR